jgi:formylglycine-generating enzyme required for sulfatase activity
MRRRDEHIWAERFDRRLEDAFALQDEICDRIVAAIQSRLAPAAAVDDRTTDASTPAVTATAGETPPRPGEVLRRLLGNRWTVAGALALVALAGALTWTLQQRNKERWAREEALPRLEALIEEDDYQGAFDLATQIGQVIPNDPRLKALEPSFTAPVSLASEPSGAMVHYRPYASTEADWRPIGRTPLTSETIPRGFGLWKVDHPGHASAIFAMRNPGVQLGNHPEPTIRARFENIDFRLHLADETTIPQGMVLVQSDPLPIALISEDAAVDLPPFYIDRFEVTNREFKEFIDAGGYSRAELWQDLPFGDDVAGWPEAVARFVDATGRTGPATWEAGTYPDGTGDHPVAGVSWFESVAYARFRDKELPTAYHWYRAAYSLNERLESLASAIIGASNFDGKGTAAAGRHKGIGPYGTYDMAGNVREWLWNESPGGRWIAGGAWNQAPYIYNELDAAPAWDRSPGNGFRCMRVQAGRAYAAQLREPIAQKSVDYATLVPVRMTPTRCLRSSSIPASGPRSAGRASGIDELALDAGTNHALDRL